MIKQLVCIAMLVMLASRVSGFGANCESFHRGGDVAHLRGLDAATRKPVPVRVANEDMPVNFKVAFLGDQGFGADAVEVLEMIRDFGAEVVLHQGDMDYNDNPDNFDNQINAVLGENFPYFASMGNHDFPQWSRPGGYLEKLEQRLARIEGAECSGELGTYSVCSYKGLLFTLNGMGLAFTGHEEFVEEAFAPHPNIIWKVCSWHNNNMQYQVGGKLTSVDLEMYETCGRFGAIIATGHEHSYARTHLMSSFADFEIASTNNTLQLSPGESFAFCGGLGGRSIRSYSRNLPNNPWWAATAASDDNVAHGPLLCTLNLNGDPRMGSCHFPDQNGQIWDSFDMYSRVGLADAPPAPQPPRCRSASLQSQLRRACPDAPTLLAEVPVAHAAAGADADAAVHLRFRPALAAGEVVDSAILELLGAPTTTTSAAAPSGTVDVIVSVIPAAAAAAAGPTACDLSTTGFAGAVEVARGVWELSDTDFDEPIWRSSDLGALIQAAVDSAAWSSSAEIVLSLSTSSSSSAAVAAPLAFASPTHSPCAAPSLAVFSRNHCRE